MNILLILKLLLALPDLIALVMSIIELIEKLPRPRRTELRSDLHGILKRHVSAGCKPASCRVDLENFKEHIVKKYGV